MTSRSIFVRAALSALAAAAATAAIFFAAPAAKAQPVDRDMMWVGVTDFTDPGQPIAASVQAPKGWLEAGGMIRRTESLGCAPPVVLDWTVHSPDRLSVIRFRPGYSFGSTPSKSGCNVHSYTGAGDVVVNLLDEAAPDAEIADIERRDLSPYERETLRDFDKLLLAAIPGAKIRHEAVAIYFLRTINGRATHGVAFAAGAFAEWTGPDGKPAAFATVASVITAEGPEASFDLRAVERMRDTLWLSKSWREATGKRLETQAAR